MIYLTGDTHGEFERIVEFCEHFHTVKSDVMIILGDAGINFSGEFFDRPKKELLQSLPIRSDRSQVPRQAGHVRLR